MINIISLYSGTPGSGKSLHVAKDIYTRLRITKRNVIATFPINMDLVTNKGKLKTGEFLYRDISDLSYEFLINHALRHHKLGIENQTLVVIDECQVIFNPREFSRADRLKWIIFFTQHRKLGYNFILISQFDRLIDRQIRCLFEYNVVHRKINNFGFLWLLPIKFFVAINTWYGNKQKCGQEFFMYRKKFGRLYDSFMMFDEDFKKYVSTNGENISQYNRDKLGLDKPIISKEDKPKEEIVLGDDEIVSNEVGFYADIFNELPESAGELEVIESDVSTAISKIDRLMQVVAPPASTCSERGASGGAPVRDKWSMEVKLLSIFKKLKQSFIKGFSKKTK